MSQFTVSAWAADSSFSASYTPDNAGDERWSSAANERWAASGALPHWLRADLGTSKVVEWYRVDPGRAGSDPSAWTFEGSDDASSWTVLDTQTGQSFSALQTKSYQFTNATAYRYYRMNISAGAASAVSVAELALGDGTPHAALLEHVPASSMSSGNFTTGIVFVANVDIEVHALSAYVGTTTGTWNLRIRNSAGTVVASASYSFNSGTDTTGWREVGITPVTLPAGTYICEQWGGGNRYAIRSGGVDTLAGNYGPAGEVTIPTNGSVTFRSSTLNVRQSAGDTEPTSALGQAAVHGFRFAAAAAGAPTGSASGSFTWVGAAAGKRDPEGAAIGSFAWAGSAVGSSPVKGSGSGSFQWVGAAAGVAPSGAQGSASGAFAWSGAAVGKRDPKATAAGSFSWSGAAAGSTDYAGAASGSFAWSGSAVGSSSGETPIADLVAPVLTSAALLSWESQPAIPEADLLRAPVETDARLRSPLILATAPDGVHDVERHAHLMPELTEAAPRRKGVVGFAGTDDYLYRVERATAGRAHVFVNGADVTFTRGKGALVRDRSSSIPVGPVSASVQFPQFQPWDRTGEGDWAWCDLDRDPQVDIVWRHNDGTEEHVWEGFGASEGDGSPGLLVNCEGLFAQAQHAPWDPPVFMDERDIGHVIADALNGVKHRRWNKIPRVTTGITTSDRGRQGESVWQYVQDLLSLAFTSSGRQWTLARVAPYTYRIQLKKAMSVVDWTVTYKAPGVNVNLTRDQSVRRDAIYGRGYAKDGGYWCGRVFPGLEFGVPPQYPMSNTSLTLAGRTDATTDTGNGITVWQRKMRDLGYSITVDGSMNSVDTDFVRQVQRARGILVDGILGPQTWAATWENNSTDADTTSYRLPLAAKTEVMPWLYSASGAKVGRNPANDPSIIAHEMPEVDFGEGISKARAKVIAERMLDLEANPPWTGTITLDTDQWESGSSRFLIREGDNVDVLGHPAGVVQVSEVSQSGSTVTLHVATRAMDRLTLAAIRERNVTARRDASSRAYTLNESSLNKASVVQYESESRAGYVPRTAVNGDVGLWTVRKTFVSQVGVAKVEFDATGPKAELVVALFNRPIRTTVLASLIADPLADSDGWYDNIETLQAKYGLMEVYGSPGNPGGYWPRQKGDGALTGKLRESGALPYTSPYGGFVWVAMFTSRSCWVEGRVFPAVPT